MDSGAFSDPPAKRLTFEGALERQLRWEREAERWWGWPWKAEALVSYDLLIDELWTGDTRKKRRWSVAEADRAVRVTVDAAHWLAGRRDRLAPRKLVLACQGVDAQQYLECVAEVLKAARPGDWLGLGGWCILGVYKSWMPTFFATIRRALPTAAAAGVRHAHIFGVMYRPALGPLLWAADQCGMTVSTDSSGPVLSTTWKDGKKAGRVKDTWEENTEWWRGELDGLRSTPHYRPPPVVDVTRQLTLWDIAGREST